MRLGDEELVVLVGGGDGVAFEELFDRHGTGVLSFCSRLLCSREEGEDALQQTFLAAYQAICERGVQPRTFKPWLYTIARNHCLSVLRSPREAALPRVDERVAASGQTADRVEQRAEVRELLGDVARLPEQQRAALLLSEVCGLSHVQIAEVIDCPREKVKSLVFQARVSLSLDREARATPCGRVREQLVGASRARWSLGLGRHLKRCEGCREFARVATRRRELIAIALPLAPTIGVKRSALAAVTGGSSGGGGGAGGGLVSGLGAKAASVSGASAAGASGASAGGGLSVAVLVKAGCAVGATATALTFSGASAIEQPPPQHDRDRATTMSPGAPNTTTTPPSLHAVVPGGDDRTPPLPGRQPPGRSSDAPAPTTPQAAGALPPSGMLAAAMLLGDRDWHAALGPQRGSLHASRGKSAPVSDGRSAPVADGSTPVAVPGARGRENPDREVRGPRGNAPKHERGARGPKATAPTHERGVRGPKPDHGATKPKPDHGATKPKPDHAQKTCQQGGGQWVEVNPLVYACVSTQLDRRPRDQAKMTCQRNNGSFTDINPLIYACVLPGGTLPNPFPTLP